MWHEFRQPKDTFFGLICEMTTVVGEGTDTTCFRATRFSPMDGYQIGEMRANVCPHQRQPGGLFGVRFIYVIIVGCFFFCFIALAGAGGKFISHRSRRNWAMGSLAYRAI